MSELPVIDEIPADTKNWMVVLERGCTECGFTPGCAYEDNERRILSLVDPVRAAFKNSALTQCLDLMLTHDAPTFPKWGQNAAAIEGQHNR